MYLYYHLFRSFLSASTLCRNSRAVLGTHTKPVARPLSLGGHSIEIMLEAWFLYFGPTRRLEIAFSDPWEMVNATRLLLHCRRREAVAKFSQMWIVWPRGKFQIFSSKWLEIAFMEDFLNFYTPPLTVGPSPKSIGRLPGIKTCY